MANITIQLEQNQQLEGTGELRTSFSTLIKTLSNKSIAQPTGRRKQKREREISNNSTHYFVDFPSQQLHRQKADISH